MKKIYLIPIIIILLTPLGLLASGSAWGEWSLDEIKSMVGYVPQGMSKFSDIINTLFKDYTIPGFNSTFVQQAIGYIFSTIIGITFIFILFAILGRFMGKSHKKNG
ncbi:MAG: PDGLE domain-containing protein [Thermoanaerobacteraceae bacterium]